MTHDSVRLRPKASLKNLFMRARNSSSSSKSFFPRTTPPPPVIGRDSDTEDDDKQLSARLEHLTVTSYGVDVLEDHWQEHIPRFQAALPGVDAGAIRRVLPIIPQFLSPARASSFAESTTITPLGRVYPPHASELIEGHLWIADRYTGTSWSALEHLQITNVVCIYHDDEDVPRPENYGPSNPGRVQYFDVVVDRNPSRESHFVSLIDDAVAYIDEALLREGARVLVHCAQGARWSPSLACACLMRACKCRYEVALANIRSKRVAADPGAVLENAVKEWWGLERAREYFPPGRGGR